MKHTRKRLLDTAAALVAAIGLSAVLSGCDGLWLSADDGWGDGPDISVGGTVGTGGYWPYYGWDGYYPGNLPVLGSGWWPSGVYPGPDAPPPPPVTHRPRPVGPGWTGGANISPSVRPGNMGQGVVPSVPQPRPGNAGVPGGGANGAVGVPTVVVR